MRDLESLTKFRASMQRSWLKVRINAMTDQQLSDWLDNRAAKAKQGQRIQAGKAVERTSLDKSFDTLSVDLKDILDDEQMRHELQTMHDDEMKSPGIRFLLSIQYICVEKEKTMEYIRRRYFLPFDEKLWERFKRSYLKFLAGGSEDLAVEALKAKSQTLQGVRQQIEYMKKMQKEHPKMYAKEIIDAHMQLLQVEKFYATMMMDLGLVGEKKSKAGTTINIINKIPRPVDDKALGANKRDAKIIVTELLEQKIATIEVD